MDKKESEFVSLAMLIVHRSIRQTDANTCVQMKDFTCCGVTHRGLHELLDHVSLFSLCA